MVLRSKINPQDVYVIPNGVHFGMYNSEKKASKSDCVQIAIISRLEYRKGTDLLIELIPKITKRFKMVKFLIGGDGIKRGVLESKIRGTSSVMLGSLTRNEVRELLHGNSKYGQIDIFLNTSLTESFCIANLEAACAGVTIVSTDVGGIPEVLPPYSIYYSKPSTESLYKTLVKAIVELPYKKAEFPNYLKPVYDWSQIALRTEKVYNNVMMKK